MKRISQLRFGFALIFSLVAIVSQAFAATSPKTAGQSIQHTPRPGGSAFSGNFGLGVMIGEPTGVTGKYWYSKNSAVDFGVAYSMNGYYAVMSDYLWHFTDVFHTRKGMLGRIYPYAGVGVVAAFSTQDRGPFRYNDPRISESAFGTRVPIGAEYLPNNSPFGVFAEAVPGIALVPDMYGFFQAEVGARFYF